MRFGVDAGWGHKKEVCSCVCVRKCVYLIYVYTREKNFVALLYEIVKCFRSFIINLKVPFITHLMKICFTELDLY